MGPRTDQVQLQPREVTGVSRRELQSVSSRDPGDLQVGELDRDLMEAQAELTRERHQRRGGPRRGGVEGEDSSFETANQALDSELQDFSPASHFLLRLRFLHPTIAVAVGAYLIFIARLAHDKRPGIYTRRLSWMLAALVLAQLGAGALNVILRAPIWLQLFHLLMSNLIWVALVLLSAAALSYGTIPIEEDQRYESS